MAKTMPPPTGDGMWDSWDPARIIRTKHAKTWVLASIVLLFVGLVVYTIATRPALEWGTVAQYMFDPRILSGLWTTIYLTALAMTIGIVTGLIAAIMLRSKNPVLYGLASLYTWLFRAIPGLVQLLIWFNLASLFPMIDVGIPFMTPWFSVSPNDIMTPLLAACLGLGLSEGAYMAEIIRGGLLSVGKGQAEAAAALGLSSRQTLFRIVLPQAMRPIIPATGNQLIGMLKYTSLASVISVSELLQSAQQIYNVNFRIFPLLVVASIWYIILTSILTVGQRFLERHFDRGFDSRAGRRATVRASAASEVERESEPAAHEAATTKVEEPK